MKNKNKGFSLVEILISMLLLSLILLGLDGMQIHALQQSRIACISSIAANQLHAMAERLRACSMDEIEDQILIWNQQNNLVLPGGRGKVEGQYPSYTLIIFWGEHKNNECKKNQIGQSGCLIKKIII